MQIILEIDVVSHYSAEERRNVPVAAENEGLLLVVKLS